MPTLYDLEAQYAFLQELDDPDYEQALADTRSSVEDKLIAIATVLKNMQADVDLFEGEADRLSQLATFRKNRIAGLKEYALRAMDQLKIDKVERGVHSIRRQKNPEGVELDSTFNDALYQVAIIEIPAALVPSNIREYVKSVRPNLTQIRALLKSGSVEIVGAKLKQGFHIRVQ